MNLIAELLGVPPDPDPGGAPRFRAGCENDRWNAARLAAVWGEAMIFVVGKGWGVWDGARFNFSDGGHRALEIADKLQGLIAEDAGRALREEFSEPDIEARLNAEPVKGRPKVHTETAALRALQNEKAAALHRHAVKCGNIDRMNATLRVLEYRQRVPLASLNADPWALICPNGQIDLRAAAATEIGPGTTPAQRAEIRAAWLKPHDRAARPTKCAAVEFDPAAECPEWRAFLELTLPDHDTRDCFHRAMGALLFGRNEAQCAFLFRGSGGNGKSTVVNAIARVLGAEADGYAVPCRIEMFLATQNESASKATPEEVDIPGARALIASEPDPTDELSAKKIKALTGGDPRPARALNMPQFFYRPNAIPILSFNRTPRIKNEDEGTRRRLVFFPFEVNLQELPPERRRLPEDINAALCAEAPGILNWMLDGWREYRRLAEAGIGRPPGIAPPPNMQALKDSLLEHADPIGEFIKDCCEPDPAASEGIRTSQFFKAYAEWCDMTGSACYGKQTVTRIMQEKGVRTIKGGGGIRFWSRLVWQNTDNVRALLRKCGDELPPPPDPPPADEIDPEAPF